MVYNYPPTLDWGNKIKIRFNAEVGHHENKDIGFVLRDQLIEILLEHTENCLLYYRSTRWWSEEKFEINCELPEEIEGNILWLLKNGNVRKLCLEYRAFTAQEIEEKKASFVTVKP